MSVMKNQRLLLWGGALLFFCWRDPLEMGMFWRMVGLYHAFNLAMLAWVMTSSSTKVRMELNNKLPPTLS